MTAGVINIYKGKGYTSFHVVAVLKRLLGEKKIGHTGTLDPDATGVLPVCVGKATKLVGELTDTDKSYRAVMLLGRSTTTQDISGDTIESMEPEMVRRVVSEDLIRRAFESFTGTIFQIPPMYSALKVGGVKLVDAARRGIEVEREARKVVVYGYSDININLDELEISFCVDCSKGTYIRTICEDIGRFIGVPACMKELERVRAAGLGLEGAITLEEAEIFAGEGTLAEHIIPTDRFLSDYPYIVVNDEALKYLQFGNYMYENNLSADQNCLEGLVPGTPCGAMRGTVCRVYSESGEFYALYRYSDEECCYKCEKMFR